MLQTVIDPGSDRCSRCTLEGAELCRALPGASTFRSRIIAANKLIVEEGFRPRIFGVLRRGYLRIEKMRDDGKRTLLGLIRPGGLVGVLPDTVMECSLETATEVEICTFEIATMTRLVRENNAVRHLLLEDLARQHEDLLDLIWRRGALTSRERVVEFLASATRTMPTEPQPDGSLVVTIPLSRRDWADMSSTTVETISRTMTWLAEKELVTTLAPTRYRVHDIAALRQLSDPDAGAADGDRTGRARPRLGILRREPARPDQTSPPGPPLSGPPDGPRANSVPDAPD